MWQKSFIHFVLSDPERALCFFTVITFVAVFLKGNLLLFKGELN